MGDELEAAGVTKDPTKKKFWTGKNIGGLFLLAIMPLAASKVMDFFSTHAKLVERVAALETEQANNKAIWTAITDQKNRMSEMEIEHRAAMMALEKEYKKSTADTLIEKYLDRQFGSKPPAPPTNPPSPPKPLDVPNVQQKPLVPDQVRETYEQQFPVKKK
jgi:hypothetical protein